MTQHDVCQTIADAANITEDQAAALVQHTFTTIARELATGEDVIIDDLGTFSTIRYFDDHDNVGVVEPLFTVDESLNKEVQKHIESHLELFATELPPEADEIDPTVSSAMHMHSELPDMDSGEDKDEKSAPNPPPAHAREESPLGRASHIEFMDVSHIRVEKDVLALLPQNVARRYGAVPVDLKEGVLTVAMVDPEDFDALQILRKETGLAIHPVLTTRDDLNLVLDQYTGLQAELEEVIESSDLGISAKELQEASQEDLQDQTNEHAPTAKIVFSLLKRAVKEHASDVHIEPYDKKLVVRFRIDGVLMARVELPKEIQPAVISRLKILASLKIDEQRLPQDGRFNLIFDHRQIDFRLSTIPVVYGEKVVMRILDKSVGIIAIEQVGLSDHGLDVLNNNLRRSHGMILVTGPTGSGKTTTLYAVLGKMMSPTVNILTLEDPVEYRIESINQSQVHAEIGYTFAAGLRAVVRQDPDIVMLGEIRDPETADMSIHAALTGHTVLSTLHTNDAAGAFPRLIDMGIEPFLITSSVHTVIAQRLARSICQNCKTEMEPAKGEMEEIKAIIATMPKPVRDGIEKAGLTFYHGKGCDICGGSGYKGRAGVFEVLDVTEPIRELVLKRSSGVTITNQAIEEGMVTMVQDGIVKALRGLTTIEEVWRVTRE